VRSLEISVTLEIVNCATCSVPFAAPEDMITRRRTDGQTLYCPSGHTNSWPLGKSDAAKLREAVEEANRQRGLRRMAEQQAEHFENSLRTAKKKARAGLCSECDKLFPDVRAHMATKHGHAIPIKRSRAAQVALNS
jgi:hypothetical protein